jgi:hypothetical protein
VHPGIHAASCCCLQVIAAGDALDLAIRQGAAVNFKNTVKYRWVSHTVAFGWTAETQQTILKLHLYLLQVPTELALESGTQAIPDLEKVRRQIQTLRTSRNPPRNTDNQGLWARPCLCCCSV